MDPHSFFADPDLAAPLLWIQLKNIEEIPYGEFSVVEKQQKNCSNVKKRGAGPNLLN